MESGRDLKMREFILGLAAAAVVGLPVTAQAQATATQAVDAGSFAQFAPAQAATADYTLDYSIWDSALKWFVLTMGKSLREFSSRPQATSGSRMVHGHDSPYRLEGNRVAFSLMFYDLYKSVND